MKYLYVLFVVINVIVGDPLQEFTNGNNLFAARFYKEAKKEQDGNFLVSPFSIQTVMALTQSGAKDETAEEIRTGLNLPSTSYKTQEAFLKLLPKLRGNTQYILKTANKIYVKSGTSVKPNFNNLASSIYQSGIESVDFSQKEEAADLINTWIEGQTESKIHDVIDPKTLDESTRVVLVNTIYFKGKWNIPFETYLTNLQDFYQTPDQVVQVDTMHNTDLFNYYEDDLLDARFLELPYQGDEASMVIVLPNKKGGLRWLEQQIEKVFVEPNFSQQRVSVSLPKFTIENKVGLKEILKALGVQTAFTESADLSGMAGRSGDIYISDVVQKAFINVTEAGTEAAAASVVMGTDRIGNFDNPGIILEFAVDHPFLFYIKLNSVILFNGRVINLE